MEKGEEDVNEGRKRECSLEGTHVQESCRLVTHTLIEDIEDARHRK